MEILKLFLNKGLDKCNSIVYIVYIVQHSDFNIHWISQSYSKNIKTLSTIIDTLIVLSMERIKNDFSYRSEHSS